MNENEVASVVSHQFALIFPELILGLMACVFFVGGTFAKGGRWVFAASAALVAASLAITFQDSLGLKYLRLYLRLIFWLVSGGFVLGGGVVAAVLGGAFFKGRQMWGLAALGTLVAATFAMSSHASFDPNQLTVSAITYDRFAVIIKAVALLGGAIIVLIGWDEVGDKEAADYYGCLLVLLAGVCLTGAANDLVTLFLALEMISIPTYVILYLQRTDLAAQESAVKYFLLSIFSAALVLFGFSYLYGLTGTTNLTAMLDALSRVAVADKPEATNTPLLALVALVMIVAGIGFKITAVPFHFYAPDVYQGTTPSVAGLLAFAPKVAGFAALFRVLGFLYYDQNMRPGLGLGQQAPVLFWILAAMTMTVGNVLALLQDNLKRMLAYSSVAHAGYMLIGLAVAPSLYDPKIPSPGGVEAVLFYLIAYSAMTLGPFGVIAYLSTKERPVETIDDLAGVGVSHPVIALLMALFMFSLIGIPLTAGFAGKMQLFMGALTAPTEVVTPSMATLFRWLALIGALNAAAGAWYYLRIVSAMYLRSSLRPLGKATSLAPLTGLCVCAAVTLILGVYPAPFTKAARAAVVTTTPTGIIDNKAAE